MLAAHQPLALLMFSGGRTRRGVFRSEAESYLCIAKHYKWWMQELDLRDDVAKRTVTEEYGRDSFENLLFGIWRFQQVVGRYPHNVTVVSWAFKRNRFELHRQAIRFPGERLRYEGFNDPIDLATAWKREINALDSFRECPYGAGGELGSKKGERNPSEQQHTYDKCPGLQSFFQFLENPPSEAGFFSGSLPWLE